MNLFVPDGVTIRTVVAPPAVSAPDTAVVIENSATLSDVGRLGRKSSQLMRMKLSWMLMPSSVTCVQVGRPPLIEVFVRLVNACTPGCALIRFVTSRFASGMSSICRWSTVLLTSGVVVFTSELPASTLTVSVSAPSSSRAVSEYSWPDVDDDVGVGCGLEALERDVDLVGADRHLREHERTDLVTGRRL